MSLNPTTTSYVTQRRLTSQSKCLCADMTSHKQSKLKTEIILIVCYIIVGFQPFKV